MRNDEPLRMTMDSLLNAAQPFDREPVEERMSLMERRTGAITLVVVGVVLIAGTLALQMFSRAPAFERMTSDFAKNVTPATVGTLRTEVADLRAAGTELQTTGLPALAALLKMTPQQFAAFAQQNFPALTSGTQQIPQLADAFERQLAVMAAQDSNLHSAAAIPTIGLSTAVLPWLIVGSGIVAIALGLLSRARIASLGAVTLGALMIVGVFAFSIPSKAADADALNKAMKPFFTQGQIDASRQGVAGLNATAQELVNKVLPAVAAAQKVPAAQLTSQFASQFPALTRAVIAIPDATDKFNTLSTTFQRNLANFNKVEPFHFAATTWALVAAGLLVMIGGAIPLLATQEVAAERGIRWFRRAA